MIFINNILLASLFLVLLSAVYFLGEKIKGSNAIINSSISSAFIEIVEAILFGLFFVAIQLLFSKIYSNFILTTFLIGFLILFFNKGILFSSITLAPGLLYFLIAEDHAGAFYLVLATTFIAATIFEITNFFTKTSYAKLATYTFLLVFSFISLFISAFGFSNGMNANTFRDQMMPFIMIIFVDILFSYAIKFSISANILYESINFVFSTYYRDSLLHQVLGNEISNKKISKGIFGVFNINFDKVTEKEEKKELIKKVLLKVKNEFPERTILFKFDEERFAFFLSTKTLDGKIDFEMKNVLFDIETYVMRISTTYKLENKRRKKAFINIGISFYGKQTSSISELETFSLYALEHKYVNKKKMISFFDYSEYRRNIKDVISVQQLDDVIGLDNYALKFYPVLSTKNNKTEFMFCEPENISETQFIEDIRMFMESIDKIDTFERYFSTEAIKSFKNKHGRFMIQFSGKRMSDKNFSNFFINSMKMKKIIGKDIVMLIRPNEIKNTENFILNILELEKFGIDFGVYLKDTIPYKLKQKFKPKFAILNNDDYIDKTIVKRFNGKDVQIIHININDEEDFSKSNKAGIKYFGGNLFQTNLFPTIFSKQSKIYLNKVIKKVRK